MAKSTCSVDGCKRPQEPHGRNGYCGMHYQRVKKRGVPGKAEPERISNRACSIEGCQRKYFAHGWCHTHYNRWMRHGSPDIVLVKQHGQTHIPEYAVWGAMKGRCLNPSDPGYRLYGGRGITVSESWKDFLNFLHDMGNRPTPQHQLERIDNDGPYSVENCQWATATEQGRNKRTNHLVAFQNETLPLIAWEERTGLSASMVSRRLKRGWSIERALTEPSKRGPQ